LRHPIDRKDLIEKFWHTWTSKKNRA
jgi:hypothetical protein